MLFEEVVGCVTSKIQKGTVDSIFSFTYMRNSVNYTIQCKFKTRLQRPPLLLLDLLVKFTTTYSKQCTRINENITKISTKFKGKTREILLIIIIIYLNIYGWNLLILLIQIICQLFLIFIPYYQLRLIKPNFQNTCVNNSMKM